MSVFIWKPLCIATALQNVWKSAIACDSAYYFDKLSLWCGIFYGSTLILLIFSSYCKNSISTFIEISINLQFNLHIMTILWKWDIFPFSSFLFFLCMFLLKLPSSLFHRMKFHLWSSFQILHYWNPPMPLIFLADFES